MVDTIIIISSTISAQLINVDLKSDGGNKGAVDRQSQLFNMTVSGSSTGFSSPCHFVSFSRKKNLMKTKCCG